VAHTYGVSDAQNPPKAVFTLEQRAKIRYLLGYPSVSQMSSSMALGIPQLSNALYLLETNFDRILPEGGAIVLQIVCQLDAILAQMATARSRIRASSIGEIKLNQDELSMLTGEFIRWQRQLADMMACPINPYGEVASFGFAGAMGGGFNVPVINS